MTCSLLTEAARGSRMLPFKVLSLTPAADAWKAVVSLMVLFLSEPAVGVLILWIVFD